MSVIIDSDKALERLDGDWDFYTQILATFISVTEPQLREFEAMLGRTEKQKELGRGIHSLKSAAGSVGADAMAHACEKFEAALGDAPTANFQIMMANVVAEFERFRLEAHALLSRTRPR